MTTRRRILLCLLGVECVVGLVLFLRPLEAMPGEAVLVPRGALVPVAERELRDLYQRAATGDGNWRALAEGLLGRGLYSRAEPAYRETLDRNPDDVKARFGLAFVLDRMGRLDECLPAWQATVARAEAAGATDLRRDAAYMVGMTLLRRELPEAAEAAFRGNTGHAASDYQLAKLLVRGERLEEALPIIERRLRRRPDALAYNALHRRALAALDRHDEAARSEDALERSRPRIAISPGTDYVRPFRERLGADRLKLEYNELVPGQDPDVLGAKLDEMEAALGDFVVPETLENTISRAEVAYLRGNRDELERLLKRLEHLGVVSPDALVLWADLLRQRGDIRAVPVWERILRFGPNAIAHRALAEHYERLGDTSRRDHHLARWRRVEGVGLLRSGRPDEARAALEESVRLDPRNSVAWFHLGEAERLSGETEAALRSLDRSLELDPHDGRARRARERVKP